MNNDLSKLVEAVRTAHADIAPTYAEYVQLAFAIATDCGEAGRSDFIMMQSRSMNLSSWLRSLALFWEVWRSLA